MPHQSPVREVVGDYFDKCIMAVCRRGRRHHISGNTVSFMTVWVSMDSA